MKHTKLTEKIGMQFPIIQAPMAGGVTTPELVAAVSNAGGLGSLGAGYMSPTAIRQAIRKIRQLTNRPFAVNLFIPEVHYATPDQIQKACDDINHCCIELNIAIKPVKAPYSQSFEEQIHLLIEEKIPVFSYTFGTLDPFWVSQFRKNRTILIGTATTLNEAIALEENGIDAIVAQGSEAGGHRGTFIGNAEDALIKMLPLVKQLIEKIKIPIIAAGGIMNGYGIVTAINAGASCVQMGTAFLSCFEASISPQYKQALFTQQQDNTVLTRAFSGKLARGIYNKFIACMENRKSNILDYPIQNLLTSTMRQKAKENDILDFMSLWAGQSANLCRNMSAKDLMNTLIFETEILNTDLGNSLDIDEKIILVPFNHQWNELYKLEATRILKKLGTQIIEIQHIGSTSIPDIYSKPIIDIMIGIENLESPELAIKDLIELGYQYLGNANVPGRLYFRKRNPYSYNIALCQYQSEIWINNLLFRDYLIKYPDTAQTYSLLKKSVFDSGVDTLLNYSEMKHPFIDEMIKKAKIEQSPK